jgi:hypothetical protein
VLFVPSGQSHARDSPVVHSAKPARSSDPEAPHANHVPASKSVTMTRFMREGR